MYPSLGNHCPCFLLIIYEKYGHFKAQLLITISVISVPEADSGKYHPVCNKIFYSFNDISPYLLYINLSFVKRIYFLRGGFLFTKHANIK